MRYFFILFLGFSLVSCSSYTKSKSTVNKPVFYAFSDISSSKGIFGKLYLTERFGKITAQVSFEGLTAKHRYGLYFHEYGDCRDIRGLASGDIYSKKERGDAIKDPNQIVGFVAPDTGKYEDSVEIPGFSLAGVNSPLIGRAIVVHSNPSDHTGSHDGRFEERVGCGVIGAAEK